jgi:hypothetical protein
MLGGGRPGSCSRVVAVGDFWFVPEDWARPRPRGGMEVDVEGRKRGARAFGFSIAIYITRGRVRPDPNGLLGRCFETGPILPEPFLDASERRTQPNRWEGGGGEGDGATNRPVTADGNLLRWVRPCSFHRLVSGRGIWPSICWILDLFRLDGPFCWAK